MLCSMRPAGELALRDTEHLYREEWFAFVQVHSGLHHGHVAASPEKSSVQPLLPICAILLATLELILLWLVPRAVEWIPQSQPYAIFLRFMEKAHKIPL